jgi:hypothetical protein
MEFSKGKTTLAYNYSENGFHVQRAALTNSGIKLTELLHCLGRQAIAGLDILRVAQMANKPFSGEISNFTNRDFERGKLQRVLAIGLGLGGRKIFDHLSPAINSLSPGYRFRPNFPNLICQPTYNLLTDRTLLDLVEQLVGTDFAIGPRIQPLVRFSDGELDAVEASLQVFGEAEFEQQAILSQHISAAPWYSLNRYCVPIVGDSTVINVCIPLVQGTYSNGLFQFLRRSHLYSDYRPPSANERNNCDQIAVNPGDVIFFDNRLMVSHNLNISNAGGFIGICFQYHRAADCSGFPHLPSFILSRNRSRDNTAEYQEWQRAWHLGLVKLKGRTLRKLYRIQNKSDALKFNKWCTARASITQSLSY